MRFFRVIAALVMLAAGLTLTHSARGASPPTTRDQVVQDYPRGITFKFSAVSDARIQSVTLLYGSDGLSCVPGGARQAIKITPGTSVEGEWTWELKRSGSVPPGMRVWRQWLVRDASGAETLTEREWFTIEDRRHRWQSLTRANVRVNWFEGDGRFGDEVLAEAQRSLEQIRSDYDVATTRTVQIWIYPEAQQLRDTLIYVPEWTGGIALAEYNSTMLAMKPGNRDWMTSVIPHELTHLLMNARIFNCRGGALPTWLNEGVAVFSERDTDTAPRRELIRLIESGEIAGLSALQRGFLADSKLANASYTYGGEVTRYMVQTLGREKFARLLDAVRDGDTFDRALQSVYGFDTDALDAQWRAANGVKRAVPQVTPTPVISAADAPRRTPVPTIALPGIFPPGVRPTPTAVPVAQAPTAPPPPPTAAPAPVVLPTVAAPPAPDAALPWPLIGAVGGVLGLGALTAAGLLVFLLRRNR